MRPDAEDGGRVGSTEIEIYDTGQPQDPETGSVAVKAR